MEQDEQQQDNPLLVGAENTQPSSLNLQVLESGINNSLESQSNIVTKLSDSGSQAQIIERIVYKKQRVHGFFRTLTIIALVIVGFLMLMETLKIFSLNINGFQLNTLYPIFIIFSSLVIWSYRGLFGKIFGLILFLGVVVGFFTIGVYTSLNPTTATKMGTEISYPWIPQTAYTKFYLTTLVSDLSLRGGKTNNLVDGNYGSDRKLLVLSGVKDNFQYYSISEETNLNLLQNYYSIVSLGFNSSQPVYLYVKNLLALQNIDFTETKVKTAKLHAAGMISDIVLGSNVEKLDIESAIGIVTIHIPQDIGVQLTYKDLVGKADLIGFEQKGPGYFESKNIATAKKIIPITMRLGFSKVRLLWDK